MFWRDLQRDEVTPSCGEVNDLIKGPLGEVSQAIDLADGFFALTPAKPRTTPRRFSCPFDALTGPHGHVKKNVRLYILRPDQSGHFATAVAFSLFETVLELAQALLQASMGQQDLDNGSKLAWMVAPDCN